MNVEIKLAKDIATPYAVIYTNELTEEINSLVKLLEQKTNLPVTAKKDDTYHVILPEEIFMVRTENQQVILYTQDSQYSTPKRLYEIEEQLGKEFLRISKTTLINLKQLASVEPSFNGTMYLKLKNGCQDYISRKYLPALKSYLGL